MVDLQQSVAMTAKYFRDLGYETLSKDICEVWARDKPPISKLPPSEPSEIDLEPKVGGIGGTLILLTLQGWMFMMILYICFFK